MSSCIHTTVDPDDLMRNLRPGHPRLMVRGEAGWEHLRRQRESDADLDRLLGAIESYGRGLLAKPPLERVMVGRRLLHTSRETLERITALGIAYHTTGERAFAERAEAELLAVCAFDDWNPSHFLDVGEMALGVALGYDWLHAELDEPTRQAVRAALKDKALCYATEPLQRGEQLPWWITTDNNWNPVCLAGLTAAALAIAEDDPAPALALLQAVTAYNPRSIAVFAPDGVHPEGPTYWGYGMTFQVVLLDVLDSALGDDLGLTKVSGLRESPAYLKQMIGPTGMAYNYSDARAVAVGQQAMLWFARRWGDVGLASGFFDDYHRKRPDKAQRFDTFAPLWWVGKGAGKTPDLPLAWHGRGEQPLVVFRQAWGDPDALWLAAKAGSASTNHAHMDAGSFVLEADGQRWAEDLGLQDYESIESKGMALFDKRQDSDRWRVFRLNNRSHNTLTINDELHRADASAQVTSFEDAPGRWGATMDLGALFGDAADRVRRTFRVDPASGVAILDEVSGLAADSTVRWVMVSRAEIEVAADGRSATLRQNGRTFNAALQLPASARFEVRPADPPRDDFNALNPGRWMLTVTVPADASGHVELLVWLGRPGMTMPHAWWP